MRNPWKNKTIQDASVVLTLGGALLVFSIYGFFHAKVKQTWVMSPYLFPMLIALFAVELGCCMLAEGRRQLERETSGGQPEKPAAEVHSRRVVAVIGLVALYYLGITWIGFVPATGLFLAAMMRYLGERRWKVILPAALLTPVVLYLVFAVGLNVRLP